MHHTKTDKMEYLAKNKRWSVGKMAELSGLFNSCELTPTRLVLSLRRSRVERDNTIVFCSVDSPRTPTQFCSSGSSCSDCSQATFCCSRSVDDIFIWQRSRLLEFPLLWFTNLSFYSLGLSGHTHMVSHWCYGMISGMIIELNMNISFLIMNLIFDPIAE